MSILHRIKPYLLCFDEHETHLILFFSLQMENCSFQEMSSITFIYQPPDLLQTDPLLLTQRECH